ncbi:MAG: alpha/beta fold hydrolase [Pseudomonadota bacterium]
MTTPSVIMLPGFDGSGLLFQPLIDAIGTSCGCLPVAYDNHKDVAGYISQIKAFCRDNGPAIVIAESFSGPLAVEVMADPDVPIVAGVLSATFAKPPLALIISLAQKLRLASLTLPAVSEQVLRLFCLNGVRDIGLIRDIVNVVRNVDAPVMESRITALTHMDATLQLSNITQPVLLLHAADDRVVRRRFSASLAEGIPNLREITVPGPHLLLQASARDCAAQIVHFVRDVG